MSDPILKVYRLNTDTGTRSSVASVPLERIARTSTTRPLQKPVRLPQSFSAIEIEIEAREGASVRVMKNGTRMHMTKRGKSSSALFTLKNDNEMHVINASVDGLFVVTLTLLVNHFYPIKLQGNSEFFAPKWTTDHWGFEYEKCAKQFNWLQDSSKILDSTAKQFSKGLPESREQWASDLYQSALSIARLVLPAEPLDFSVDFAKEEPQTLDVQRIIEETKRNPTLLELAANGPIVINGERYTTHAIEWRDQTTQQVDLSIPVALVAEYIARLRKQSCPLIVLDVLKRVHMHLNNLSTPSSSHPKPNEILHFFRSQKSTTIGKYIQHYLVTLRMLVMWSSTRSRPSELAEHGLLSGIRDFDLFEWSALRNVGSALGYSPDELSTKKPYFDTQRHHFINGNVEGSSALLKNFLTGWRDLTTQPSGYIPDIVVIHDAKEPIIVDAKFRIGRTIDQLASADSVKDVQAYMDEYGRSCAIIIVPLIPMAIGVSGGGAKSIEGHCEGRRKSLFIVELNPFNTAQFRTDFCAAIDQCAALQSALKD